MNQAEFIEAVKGCQESLRRYLTALCCGDSMGADDIAQDALVKAWLALDSFRGDSTFATWVRRIAFNSFMNYRRKPDAQSLDEVAEMAGASGADDSFRYQELYNALSKLTPRERSSVVLFYLEGYSIKEISKIEDSTEGAIKQHLSRGREHLRKLLNA